MKDTTSHEMAERLRKHLAVDYDVIVVANVNWDVLPLDCQYAILKKVKAGTGLAGFVPAGTKIGRAPQIEAYVTLAAPGQGFEPFALNTVPPELMK